MGRSQERWQRADFADSWKTMMQSDKIVVYAHVYDQADLLRDYLDWYLDLGVDLLLVQDNGSTDGSHDVLEEYARRGRVKWFVLPERDMRKYNSGDTAVRMAKDLGAEWIIQCDADEFLRLAGPDLRSVLQDAKDRSHTVINVPCFNMTGPIEGVGGSAIRTLTVRIDRPTVETYEQQISGDMPVPYIFIRHPIKSITYAPAYESFIAGSHGAKSEWGTVAELPNLFFLHYPVRGFEAFEKKIRNTMAWFRDNPHLEAWWGWHWRRWIRLYEAGQLQKDFEQQFVTPQRAQELIREGICSIDDTVARWAKAR
jgi:glycosyltransferase involved in cell wall biosynthesis